MPRDAVGSEQKYTNKTTRSIASPFQDPAWPTINPNDQKVIEDLLLQLVSPIGEHRQKYAKPSQGKRARKRRRKEIAVTSNQPTALSKTEPPPMPDIFHGLTVGFNCTHRALEAIIQTRATQKQPEVQDSESNGMRKQLAVVFVDRSTQPKIMHGHLPLLVSGASDSSNAETSIRLIALAKGSEERLSTALHIPRVGLIGIYQDASSAKPLLDLVRDKVPAIDHSWLRLPKDANYLPLQIDTQTRKVPVQLPKSVRRQQAREQEARGANNDD